MPEQERRTRATQNGFSICEVMVASAVMAVSLLGLAQLLGLAFLQDQMSRYNTMAIELGRGKVEELRNLYLEEIRTGTAESDLTDGDHGPETIILTNGVVGYEDHSLTLSWSVQSVGPVRKNVEVSVIRSGLADRQGYNPMLGNAATLETVLLP